MSDLKIQRAHTLGLERARAVAKRWSEHAEKKFEMSCSLEPGADGDTVRFTRSGVSGEMRVTGDAFELSAKLGFLFKPFLGQIEAETAKQLDAALAKEAARNAG